ncbi:putative HTH-type transcriptional regulator YfiR [termite gut metagenome]|uniref:Putative HTH-type transcriptional regulator YfiR n=1 Tax=termite gut metagenome TaxID=433724 RepID=A0A5J4RTH9_9ZZZZ
MKDTKEHIVKTAFLLFLQKSYKAVTLKDIISSTGLSNGAFYHYFDNKEQLFKEVVEHYLFRITGQVFKSYPKSSLWDFIQYTLRKMEKIYDTVKNYANKGESVNFIYFMFEALRYFPEVREETIRLQHLELNTWVEMIGVAKANGEIKSNLPNEIIARFFTYMPDGNGMAFAVDNDFKPLKQRIRELWEGLYTTLKA